jgi:hypothetical protein
LNASVTIGWLARQYPVADPAPLAVSLHKPE